MIDSKVPHRMTRAVPGDQRCAECGMTRGTRAHREGRALPVAEPVVAAPTATSSPEVEALAEATFREITLDVRAGRLPRNLTAFEQLDNHADANVYLERAGQAWPDSADEATWARVYAETNAITDAVTARMRAAIVSNPPGDVSAVAPGAACPLSADQVIALDALIMGRHGAHLAWIRQLSGGEIVINELMGGAPTAEEIGEAIGEPVIMIRNKDASRSVAYRLAKDKSWCRTCLAVNGHVPGCGTDDERYGEN